MNPKNNWTEDARKLNNLEQGFFPETNFGFHRNLTSFSSQQNICRDANFAYSNDFDRNMGLQVVPSFDDVFIDFFSQNDDEQNDIHQNNSGICSLVQEIPAIPYGSLNYSPKEIELGQEGKPLGEIKLSSNESDEKVPLQETLGKLCERINYSPKERVLGQEETDLSQCEFSSKENTTTERRQSDTDSLDVYLKPCVITPTKVEDLYSTLEGEENIIFQFPPTHEINSSNLTLSKQEKLDNNAESEVFKIQRSKFSSLRSYSDLNIELNNEENLNPYHSNFPFEQTSYCSTSNMTSSHLLNSHSELRPGGKSIEDKKENTKLAESSRTDLQQSCNYFEGSSSNSLSFPPFLFDLSGQRLFPPKPTSENSTDFLENASTQSLSFNLERNITKREKSNFENRDNKEKSGFTRKRSNTKIESQIDCTKKLIFEERTLPIANAEKLYFQMANDEVLQADQLSNQSSSRYKTLVKETLNKSISKTKSSGNNLQMSNEADREDILIRDSRNTHNDTEKQRRDQMKGRFENLRKVIPKIERAEKTPKVQILKQAWKYVRYLEEEERELERVKQMEKERNRKLLQKLEMIIKM